MAQPKMGLVRWMLGRTFYPDNSYTRDREGNPIRPYDMATDAFSESMGVRCDQLAEAVTQGRTKMAGDMGKVLALMPVVRSDEQRALLASASKQTAY